MNNQVVLIATTVILFGLFLFYYRKSNVAANRYFEQRQTDVGYWNFIYIMKLRETIKNLGGSFGLNDVQQHETAYYIAELRDRMVASFSNKNAIDEYITLISKLVFSISNKRGDVLILKDQLRENGKKLVPAEFSGDWQEHLNMTYIIIESTVSQKITDAVNRSVTALRAIDSNM